MKSIEKKVADIIREAHDTKARQSQLGLNLRCQWAYLFVEYSAASNRSESEQPMTEMTARTMRVSAPGKALVAGGYLVLDEQHAGLVLATSARFHAQIETIAPGPEYADKARPGRLFGLSIDSPQYGQRLSGWITRCNDETLKYELLDASDHNQYIEETIVCAINGIAGLQSLGMANVFESLAAANQHVLITLQADNDFYSQVERLQQAGQALTRDNLRTLSQYLPPVMKELPSGDRVVLKTGMGSSAALVTSLVAAAVSFFVPTISIQDRRDDLQLVHNLAQLSHCFIQRKVGSGFDVSAACFGSQQYSRFPSSMLAAFSSAALLEPTAIGRCITDYAAWDVAGRVKPFQLPRGFHLMMGDVMSGSATVSMVRKVLDWQKSVPEEASRHVSALNNHNIAVERTLKDVGQLVDRDGSAAGNWERKLELMAAETHSKWGEVDLELADALHAVRSAFLRVREHLREMGRMAGVPIEPPEQTALLDATMRLPGVLVAGVPGAGGYDAIFVIAIHQNALLDVEKLWVAWPETHPGSIVCPLLCDVDDHAGVRLEPVAGH